MPSPLGRHWLDYIHHRLKMLKKGMEVYATSKYTRLGLDKHIESYRAIDQLAGKMVNYQPALIFIGNGETPMNSPIRIKKHVRCPSIRKLIKAFKKRGNCIVLMVDEYFTSQTCGRCFGRFDPRTKRDKFKVCQDCRPREDAMLPSKIVTQLGKRTWQNFRKMERELMLEQMEAANSNLPDPWILLSKVKIYRKKWQKNLVTGEIINAAAEHLFDFDDESELDADAAQQRRKHKTVWHRDIVAAKCILIKGIR